MSPKSTHFELTSDTMDKISALRLCAALLDHSWSLLTDEDFNFEVVSGGLSNRLYLCEDLSRSPLEGSKVLIRLYGGVSVGEDHPYKKLNRADELLIFFEMGKQNLVPQVLGLFPGGRLEQYIPVSSQTLSNLLVLMTLYYSLEPLTTMTFTTIY